MQTLSKMQRNRLTQKNIGYFLAFAFFALYCFLGDIFLFLPPMLGVMFVLFSHSIVQRKYANLVLIFLFLLWMECDRGLPLGVTTLFFSLYYFAVYIPFEFLFRKNKNFAYVVLVYFGFFILLASLGSYGEALEWVKFFALCVYYAIFEGILARAFKI